MSAARSSLIPFVLLLAGLDAAAVAALRHAGQRFGQSSGHGAATAGRGEAAMPEGADTGWALCLTRFEEARVTPASVAITYIDAGLDGGLTPGEVRSWFGDLDGRMVDVYKLEQANGRRRIAFELSRGKWPAWERVAGGHTGEAVCGLVRAALLRAGIGRPRADRASRGAGPADGGAAAIARGLERSRHDFEFIYARRPALYRSIEWVGTLDHALAPDRFAALLDWVNGS